MGEKLFAATKNAESIEAARLELEEHLERLKLEAQTHIESLSSLTEELKLRNIELDQTRDKLARSDLEVETRTEELSNLIREIESLRKCLSDGEVKYCEIVKELQLSQDREKAHKGLKDQMISYQKDLQEQIRYDTHGGDLNIHFCTIHCPVIDCPFYSDAAHMGPAFDWSLTTS